VTHDQYWHKFSVMTVSSCGVVLNIKD